MKTRTTWDFTPDEFAWVWGETGLDRYSYPIKVIESVTDGDQAALLRAEISARYPRHADPDLTGPLRVIAHPELRIICTGHNTTSHKRGRSLAAASGGIGVILFQKPGATPDSGGNIKLVVTQRHMMGKHIAATMPTAEPGRLPQLAGFTERLRSGEKTSYMVPGSGPPPEEQIRALLLSAPRTREGHLCVETHLQARNPPPRQFLNWIDIRDDSKAAGRYLIDVAHHTTVTPASQETIARELDRRTHAIAELPEEHDPLAPKW